MEWLRHNKTGVIYPFEAILANHRYIEKYNPDEEELEILLKQYKIKPVEKLDISESWGNKIDKLSGIPDRIIEIMKAILSLDQNNLENFNSLGTPRIAALDKILGKKTNWKHRDRAVATLKEIGYEIKSRGNNSKSTSQA